MSTIYTLPAIIASYEVTMEQWFDPEWVYVDVRKLHYYYRGERAYLVFGSGQQPEYFEVRTLDGIVKSRYDWATHWEELTSSENAVHGWIRVWGKPKNRIGKADYTGMSWYDRWTLENRDQIDQLVFHIRTRKMKLDETLKREDVLPEFTVGQRVAGVAKTVLSGGMAAFALISAVRS